MSHVKETNYLALKNEPLDFRGPGDAESINHFSVTTEAEYLAMFRYCGHRKAIGEASPLYLYSPKAGPAIQAMVPDAKLIMILRNPIDRAYSAFLHLVRDRREPTHDFLEALHLEPERIADHWEHIWHYVEMGRYADQVARYQALFPPEQIKLYIYRDFRLDPQRLFTISFAFWKSMTRSLPTSRSATTSQSRTKYAHHSLRKLARSSRTLSATIPLGSKR